MCFESFERKLCASIGNISYKQLLQMNRYFEFIELRIDLIDFENLSFEQIVKIIEQFFSKKTFKTIATCRPGKFTEDERLYILEKSVQSATDFLDIEIELPEQIIRKFRKLCRSNGSQLIISYHNFERTDEKATLESYAEKAFSLGADYFKIACNVRNVEDCKILLDLAGPKIIAIGMGKLGMLVRLTAPLLGSPFTYVAAFQATAPGQVDYEQAVEFYRFYRRLGG